MFGNLLNNKLIDQLHREKKIEIDPFRSELLQVAQYPLSAKEIRYWKPGEDTPLRHNLMDSGDAYRFQPREYAMAVVRERVVLSDGIVGRFIPMSGLIERGFGLTAGKLDPHYGREGEELRFGITNLRDTENEFAFDSPLAYIEFFDVRGLPSGSVTLSDYDKVIRLIRRGEGDTA